MDGSIARLHCRYRLIGPASLASLTDRLDWLVRDHLAEAWGEALDRTLGDDPTVYVLRRVRTSLALPDAQDLTDAGLAQRWGQHMAGAVIRSIARDSHDGENLVRFQDKADFVVCFINDVLDGRAWMLWYYRSFSPLRTLPLADALRDVLLDHTDDLASILARLHRYGNLQRVLGVLDGATLRQLWRRGLLAAPEADSEALRPLVEAALAIARELGVWTGASTKADELQVPVAELVPEIDWLDGSGLTDAVLAILRYLAERGYLRRPAAPEGALFAALDRALAAHSWLDATRLRTALVGLLLGADAGVQAIRPRTDAATPRQRDLLKDLASAAREIASYLDVSDRTSARNALLLHAALVAQAPQWANDPAVESLVDAVLAAWAANKEAGLTAGSLHRVARGELAVVLASVPVHTRPRARAALQLVVRLGGGAVEVIECLTGDSPKSQEKAGWVESSCAGVLLLLRAVMDLRLHHAASEAAYPAEGAMQAFLVALGQCLTGAEAADEYIDPAVRLFAGVETSLSLDHLRDAWQNARSEESARFQAALLAALAGQRLIHDTLQLHRVHLEDGRTVLVGGDGGVYPFGRALVPVDETPSIVAGWLSVWQDAFGAAPSAVVYAPALAGLLPEFGGSTVVVPEEVSEEEDDLVRDYRENAVALAEAMQTLTPGGRLSSDANLTLSLTAIALLRAWSRWLRQFTDSSAPYLLESFINRPGRLLDDGDSVLVELGPRPLDIVLEMAGYFLELENVPWLGGRKLQFRAGGA